MSAGSGARGFEPGARPDRLPGSPREAPVAEPHPDDRFHPPSSDDPYWTETCWFTFAVPERKLSAQLYPFFRPNQGVTSCGAFVWDDGASERWRCLYSKNLWHVPLPADADLTDLELEPLRRAHHDATQRA